MAKYVEYIDTYVSKRISGVFTACVYDRGERVERLYISIIHKGKEICVDHRYDASVLSKTVLGYGEARNILIDTQIEELRRMRDGL